MNIIIYIELLERLKVCVQHASVTLSVNPLPILLGPSELGWSHPLGLIGINQFAIRIDNYF